MKACVLASGSKGNVSYVASSTTQILVDLGTTSSYAEKRLLEIGVDPKDISAIVISHTHSDHINGLKVFIKKYNPTLFVSEKMYQDLFEPIMDKLIVPRDEQKYGLSFYSKGILAVIMLWLADDCKEPIDKIMNIIMKYTPTGNVK